MAARKRTVRKGKWKLYRQDGSVREVNFKIIYDPYVNETQVWTGQQWHIHPGTPGETVVAAKKQAY